MSTFCVEVHPASPPLPDANSILAQRLREAGAGSVRGVYEVRLFTLDGELDRAAISDLAGRVLVDPVTERAVIRSTVEQPPTAKHAVAIEVHPRPGVMDPVAETMLAELRGRGYAVAAVRTGRRYVVTGEVSESALAAAAARALANDCIEEIVPGVARVRPAPRPPEYAFKLRTISLRSLDAAGLEKLSRDGHLFLALDEMQAVQSHFAALGRDPTDLELETIAQTWSEHCVHKTLRGAFVYRGKAMPEANAEFRMQNAEDDPMRRRTDEGDFSSARGIHHSSIPSVELRYGNLLKDTIARATHELKAEGRGPQCLSVFQDNAGVIAFDDEFGVAFKVETHNHPSAIEPYGGAATGVGGCIRDVIGCGLGARPIANTDVFCVAPPDWPQDALPRGVLHPGRVLRGIVQGVADYGNRMGIPTVNGAVFIDPRYLGNPLVFCGCVGLIPRDRIEKAAQPGDRIVLIGGRTGRDGIHGATFSSAELTDAHADEFSHAVQIGNAITEKRVLDAVLAARDADGGCLYTAITDCGAGGLSSAVGEMGATVGAVVDLERVPLKYSGLRYDEIWVSEAQERMVLAVPAANLERFMQIMRDEEVEATDIGVFGDASYERDQGSGVEGQGSDSAARLIVRFKGVVVGDLDMRFLHDGLPKRERVAEWSASQVDVRDLAANPKSNIRNPKSTPDPTDVRVDVAVRLASANIASREWIIRKYDHEVQGGSVVKPLCGPGAGPSDAAVLRPRPGSSRGIAIGCGLSPQLSDVDPYWMAANAIDEAIRNVVCVGGEPSQTAILDNFCWGRSDDAQNLGALVRACQACYDAAKAYGTPFISGKDSLNNEFLLDPGDIEALLAAPRAEARSEPQVEDPPRRAQARGESQRSGVMEASWARHLPAIERRIRATGRIGIPPTLLISALALVDNVERCVTADLKQPGNSLLLIGGLPQIDFSLSSAVRVHAIVAAAIRAGLVRACHDVSDGGWLLAVAEMALAGDQGVDLQPPPVGPAHFAELSAGYVLEVRDADGLMQQCAASGVPACVLGIVATHRNLTLSGAAAPVSRFADAWRGGA